MLQQLSFIKSLLPSRLMAVVQPWYHFVVSFAAACWYRFPSRRIAVIGITGTKGKTTVVELLHEILEANGGKAASASSLRFRIGSQETRNKSGMTMPGRFFLQKFLRDAVRAGCRFAILEVTSQGIIQSRHRFITFRAAAYTNVAPEHIEAHGSFESYLRAKLDLFWRLSPDAIAVINRKDRYADRFSAATAAEKIWYDADEIAQKKKTWPIRNLNIGDYGIIFDLKGHQIKSPLTGEINFLNILCASAVALGEHVSPELIARGVSAVASVSGRMEMIQREPFRVVVDYAHTPDSLRAAYTALAKGAREGGGLVCVLGAAGGGRDKWKRPEMGRIAAEFCREIFVTNEDPFDESPEEIMEDVAAGVRQYGRTAALPDQGQKQESESAKLRIILDRREAIREALKSAKAGDAVVMTGKGSEMWMRMAGGKKIPWNEKEIVREELEGSVKF